jgi:hypothetical protein
MNSLTPQDRGCRQSVRRRKKAEQKKGHRQLFLLKPWRGLSDWLTSFHGLPLMAPQPRDYLPLNEHLEWHRNELYHEPGRSYQTGSHGLSNRTQASR